VILCRAPEWRIILFPPSIGSCKRAPAPRGPHWRSLYYRIDPMGADGSHPTVTKTVHEAGYLSLFLLEEYRSTVRRLGAG
jgi:hypothetical protein